MASVTIEYSSLLHKHKLSIAAKYAGLKVQCKEGSTSVTLKNGAKAEFIGPALRAIGQSGSPDVLLGGSPQDTASIDSWLEFAESELENKKGAALRECIKATLEPYLKTKTFLVADGITLADISVSLSLYPYITSMGAPADCTSVARWFKTCINQPEFQEIMTGSSYTGPSAAPAASAANAGGKGSAELMLTPDDRPLVADYTQCGEIIGGRTKIGRIHLAADKGASLIGKKLTVCGWVKKMRDQAEFTFLEVNDGSCFKDIQIVVDKSCKGFDSIKGNVNTGASVKCYGSLVKSPAAGQMVEMSLKEEGDEFICLGSVDAREYPLPPKPHSREYLREKAHLRPRSNLVGAIARVRSALAFATHEFFRRKGFLYVHTPLITASDCEGAGEMFQVTTLLDAYKSGEVPYPKDAKAIDFSKDFFKAPSYLSVSGQLAVENYCCSMSDVYTFGPTFRAENSHTNRHLSEFWMIEPEIAFADIKDVMSCAEDYLKFCVQYVWDNNMMDLEFFDKQVEKGLIARLQNLLGSPFGRMSYTEVIEFLKVEVKNGKFKKYLEANYKSDEDKKKYPELLTIEWGMDLSSHHEKYLAEMHFKKPVAVYNYPSAIKSFYMRANADGKTCGAMDILAPLVGEVVGGSQREERYDVLVDKLKTNNLDPKDYWWYLELRKYGTVPHGGFGLGFERLVMLTTGVENIRDVIPFPRYPGHAEF